MSNPILESFPERIHSARLLTTAEVARLLGVVPRTVCLWAECQEIPAMKVGRQWRFRPHAVAEWLRHRDNQRIPLPTEKINQAPLGQYRLLQKQQNQ